MKHIFSVIFITFCLLVSSATVQPQRGKRRFNPQKFQAELEQFITTESGLTPQESAAFFPVYRDMRKKQMTYFAEGRRFRHLNVTDEKACEEAIRKHAANEVKIKEIQQQYHLQFLTILPACKVFKIIRAEEKFHRQMMRRVAMCRQQQLKVKK